MNPALRAVETESDIEAFLDVRARVDPEYPITRANFDDGRGHVDRIRVRSGLLGAAQYMEAPENHCGHRIEDLQPRPMSAEDQRHQGDSRCQGRHQHRSQALQTAALDQLL